MIRLAPAIAVAVVWAGPAVALDEPITKAADTFLNQGTLGAIIVVLAAVVGYREIYIRSLWTARLDDQKAFKAEILAANKDSTEGLAKSAAATVDLTRKVDDANREGAERGRAFSDGLAPLLPIQTGIAANGSSLTRMEADVRAILNRETRP